MSTEYDEEEMGESGPVTTQEKGGLQNIMSEKHLVCKGPSAVVGIQFPILQIQQLVSIVSGTNCLTPPPLPPSP